jgi:ABC-type multidrug transport system fused ATPase/permease subunit
MGGALTYGAFSTYLGYISMVFTPLRFFSYFAMMSANAAEAAGRITRTLDAVPDVLEGEAPTALSAVRGEIEFTGVRFHYVPNRPILRGVTFRIAAGEHIGLVGQTGCGKSTIANLLLRMYDVTGGRIRLDGFDVRDLSIATLRRSIAIVSQEVHIFYGSIAENIRFARPDASDEEVVAAAKSAGAHDFIMALSEGYNTVVGPGGRTLSGGECQRVSIARAIITSPAILILDEATAAMDNETEQRIATALEKLTKGRTTISIAHRLSTLRDCDRIMAMDGGRIVEEGTREELIAKGGIFCKLYTLQNEQLEQVLKGVTENDENA